jgi:hypothetical protein
MEITGKIKVINETKSYGDKGFRKREVVITTEGNYPQPILIEFVQDKCDVINGYGVGDDVKIGINLKGREWINPQKETKYFNSIEGWKIEKSDGQENQSTQKTKSAEPQAVTQDDLPF